MSKPTSRDEQIEAAANRTFMTTGIPAEIYEPLGRFIQGAKWADANPPKETQPASDDEATYASERDALGNEFSGGGYTEIMMVNIQKAAFLRRWRAEQQILASVGLSPSPGLSGQQATSLAVDREADANSKPADTVTVSRENWIRLDRLAFSNFADEDLVWFRSLMQAAEENSK